MSSNCSRCGTETNYSGDLHCRSVLIDGVKKLLSLDKIEEAERIVAMADFDKNWKEGMFTKLALEPIRKRNQLRSSVIENARMEFEGLANIYNAPLDKIVDENGPTLGARILLNLEEEKDLEESELEWLKQNNMFQTLANYYLRLSSQSLFGHNAWNLSKASSNFRRASLPEKAIEITNDFQNRSIIDPEADSAVYTSRGGAYRDLRDFSQAKICAFDAIKIFPMSFFPYTLLGAICYAEGNLIEGDGYFAKAESLGATSRAKDAEIRTVLQQSEVKQRRAIIDYLLKKDPEKYAWVERFQV